jgi:hypothetical protein
MDVTIFNMPLLTALIVFGAPLVAFVASLWFARTYNAKDENWWVFDDLFTPKEARSDRAEGSTR